MPYGVYEHLDRKISQQEGVIREGQRYIMNKQD